MSTYFSETLESIYLTPESLSNEKSIVFSEIQRRQSDPDYKSMRFLTNIIANKNPYQYSNLGIIEEMNALKIEEVEQFFNKYCVVENMVLIISGGCTLLDIEKNFSKINFLHGSKHQLPKGPKILEKKQRLFYEQDIPQNNVFIFFEGPKPNTKEYFILNFVQSFAHNGFSSRFYKKIRNEKGLAYVIQNNGSEYDDTSYFGTTAGVPTIKTDETIETIVECYQELIVEGMHEDEIRKRIDNLWFLNKRNSERSLDWVKKFDYCLHEEENPIIGDFPDIFNFREKITPEEISSVLKKYVTLDNFHIFISGKESSKKYF